MRISPRTGLPIIPKEPPRASARCAEPPPAGLLAGIAEFKAGQFWQCHETLEQLWRHEPDPIRSLYQGILLIGVGYYLIERGSHRGAATKLAQGLERLAPFRPRCMGTDVEALADAAMSTMAALRAGDSAGLVPPNIAVDGRSSTGELE